ncbi:N-formylglutamate amidohydrolase [Paenibacillus favisporus]|nr:N-formylglutamate amidohydrolase [Paenibacillus favisporus]
MASIPHGSSLLTDEMKSRLVPGVILSNNDWYVRELYDFLDTIDFTVISANYSRYVIDVNRDMSFRDNKDNYRNSLIYHKTTFGEQIYDTSPDEAIIKNRIETMYLPYHHCLAEEIGQSTLNYRKVYLFDLHSFYIQSSADIVLGTRGGQTCSQEFLNVLVKAFREEGFKVEVDAEGLTGGYIVSHYGSLSHTEAVQIEIRYTTYIEDRVFGKEEVIDKNNDLFIATKGSLHRAFIRIKAALESL